MGNRYSRATTEGFLSKVLAELVPVWKNRLDSEHEQAAIRLIAGFIAVIYLIFVARVGNGYIFDNLAAKISIISFFGIASIIILWLIINPSISVSRRLLGCIIDNAGATAALFIFGNLAVPVFAVYLWVTFGNGFRFGKNYLFFSMTLGILGYGSVCVLSSEWSFAPLVNYGFLLGLIALPLYVASLLKKLETALSNAEVASRAKSDFLATMSHEIRTPLNGLIGMLTLLDMTELKSKQQHYVDLMGKSSRWLLNVISDGLDFTKIEAGELVIEPAPMKIRTIIDDISDIFQEVAQAKGISFKRDFAESIPEYVVCDPNRLTQVLNNLLNNACKFTKSGEVRLKVTSEDQANQNIRLKFIISDSGIGIAKENLEKIFSPFKQVELSASRIQGGTGLGLAIAGRLIKLMGGNITVESELGIGTSFSFFIDVKIASEDEIQGEGGLANRISLKNQPKVLLVEDNLVNMEVGRVYLKSLGCEVYSAIDGHEAVEMASNYEFDLIFMDCQMPRMDGYEATRKIRSLETKHLKNTIIALTAHITNRDKEKCFAAGMDDYMGKPYKIEDLERIFFKWLDSNKIEEKPVSLHGGLKNPEKSERVDSSLTTKMGIHKLRNTLSGVIGGLELAEMYPDDPDEWEKHLNIAMKAAEKAVELVTDLEQMEDSQ